MAVRDPVRHKLTYEDYLRFPEDGSRHEILDGEHYVTAAPYPRHQSVVAELTGWIVPFVRQRRLGRFLPAPVDVLLDRHDIVQPDLLFISNASNPKRNEARIYRRSGERLQRVAELTAAARDLLTSPFFPGLEIPLFEIFL